MTTSSDNFDRIERYLANEMPAEEKRQFEKELADNAELLEETILYRELKEGLVNEDRKKLRADLQEMLLDESPSHESIMRSLWSRRNIYGIAATILLVLVASVLYFLNQKGDPQEVFLAYYEPYPIGTETRDAETPIDTAAMLYATGRYEAALQVMKKKTTPSEMDNPYNLGIACAYLSLNDPESALQWLIPLTTSSKRVIQDHARWYAAMAYLQKGNTRQSKDVLEQIASSKSVWQEDARKVLQEL